MTPVCRLLILSTLLFAPRIVPTASAYFPGGGKDAGKGNDCLIGYGEIDPSDVALDGSKQVVTCTDCDPQCDADGVPEANGRCDFQVRVCINQPDVEECTPAAALSSAKATGKVSGKKGKIAISVPQLLEGSGCGEPFDLTVPLRKHGKKSGSGTVTLLARVKKDVALGVPESRKDKDKLKFVCVPRPAGEACPGLTSTTLTSSTSSTATSTSSTMSPSTTFTTSTTTTTIETTTTSTTIATTTSTPSSITTTSTTISTTTTVVSGTTTTTTIAQPCGNGVVDPGEQCDPNGPASCGVGQVCNYSCQCEVEPVCGDGIVSGFEACDATAEPSGCNPGENCLFCVVCLPAFCGDGVVDPGEQCDPYGPASCEAGQVCNYSCQCEVAPVCGDGIVSGLEACDPTAEPSGCEAGATCIGCSYCALPCGNGVIDVGEACDPNGPASCGAGAVCDESCQCQPAAVCGDGTISPGFEVCDPAAEPSGCAGGGVCTASCASCEEPGGCVEPTIIPPGGGMVQGTTSGPSLHAGGCGGEGAPEAVFAWTPERSGYAEITTCGGADYDTLLYVRSGACVEGPELACNDDSEGCDLQSRVVTEVTSGETYYIFVDGYSSASGAFTLQVTPPSVCGDGTISAGFEVCDPAAEPSGCAGGSVCTASCASCEEPGGCVEPTIIPPGGGMVQGTTSGPSLHAGGCGGEGAPEAVFAWTPETSGYAEITTCGGADYDTLLYVRSGACVEGSELACNDDSEGCDLQSRVVTEVTSGETYYIFVDGYSSASGAFTLQVTSIGGACGDGVIAEGIEACDPAVEPSGCEAGTTCVECAYCGSPCGNGVVDSGEQCDPYAASTCAAGEVCDDTCQCAPAPVCGDGVFSDGLEVCDPTAEPSGCSMGSTCYACLFCG